MRSVLTSIKFDVHLTDEERKAVQKLLDRKDAEVMQEAQLVVKVGIKVQEKKP